jgi:hypothetical protein
MIGSIIGTTFGSIIGSATGIIVGILQAYFIIADRTVL